MVFFLFLFFNIFSLSFQVIPTWISCDDRIKGVYLVEGGTAKPLAGVWDGKADIPYVYDKLNVVEGDLIRFTCHNYVGGYTFGSGCFYVYGNCYCYDFDSNNRERGSHHKTFSVQLGGKTCSKEIYALKEYDQKINYDYEHYIPLDATKIGCQNDNEVLFYLNGVSYSLTLKRYITSVIA